MKEIEDLISNPKQVSDAATLWQPLAIASGKNRS